MAAAVVVVVANVCRGCVALQLQAAAQAEPHQKDPVSPRVVFRDDFLNERYQQCPCCSGSFLIDGDAVSGEFDGEPAEHAEIKGVRSPCTHIAEGSVEQGGKLDQVFLVAAVTVQHDDRRCIFRFRWRKIEVGQ